MALQDWPAVMGIEEDCYFKPDAGQLFGLPPKVTFARKSKKYILSRVCHSNI
jgi:hypothetical protein